MVSSNIPSTVSFANGQSVTNYFKAFINFMNVQSEVYANLPFAIYYSESQYKTLTYSTVDRLSTNLACKWHKDLHEIDVVSFIGDHSVDYLIVILAAMKLRVTLMLISPRNSNNAVINLLEKTKSKLLIANSKYQTKVNCIAEEVPDIKVLIIESMDIDKLVEEPLNPDQEVLMNQNFTEEDIKKPVLVLHSSGSTSLPKPLYFSNQYLFNLFNYYKLDIITSKLGDLDETDTCLSCVPIFHTLGLFSVFTMCTIGGKIVFLEKLPVSPNEIQFALEYNNCTLMCAPPIIYAEMVHHVKETKNYANIRRLKLALFGGAPFKKETGEWLHKHMNIRNLFGSTEMGIFMTSDVNPLSDNWNSLAPYQIDPTAPAYVQLETDDQSFPDKKHLYIRAGCPTLATNVCNRPDGGYSSNDLFIEDPNYPGYYCYIGRRDDILTMQNGEKTSPIPMESTIRQCSLVKQVVVLGENRLATAALIEINMDYAICYGPEEIISIVHAAVKDANKECPSHSTILPQMIKILPFNKTLPSTDKGTVVRKQAEAEYIEIVEGLYKEFMEGSSRSTANNKISTTWTTEKTEGFLTNSLAEVLCLPESYFKECNKSMFDYGLNSLTSVQLCNRISEYFGDIPQNLVFQFPTIQSLSKYLLSGVKEDATYLDEMRYRQTQDLANEYIKKANIDFPIANGIYSNKSNTVIMLTGATGSLGSFMLRNLLQDSSVKKVYAIIRGEKDILMDRLFKSFKDRSLDTSLLMTDRLEVLPMNFNDTFLGFGKDKYYKLKQEVTIVQHCAWLLDFNMSIEHYNKECIAPFYNLLKFAFNQVNPMHMHFVSSVSASANYGDVVPEDHLPLDSHVCMPMGYAHSKFVVEVLLGFLIKEKNFPCYIERLGQVCGDSINGIWNTSEQYPLMFIGGGSVMHKMPVLDVVVDWVPVDHAATSITDIMLRTADLAANTNQSVYHIVNTRTIPWNDILQFLKEAGMSFDTVIPSEWIEELQKNNANPAYKLLNYYEQNFNESFKMPIWETRKTASLIPNIKKTPIVDASSFIKLLKYWESVGFYDPFM
ncbi:hypothetical protein INT47_006490 [Mucor saturninus]|uniref:Carrier domain-containing protein n=1 Tax=Mucor saturninus TaxID=64648 RepID=A0A8H7QPP6_9FUNG|nr:hypothetical protein INT47_006490 [Mucor saturninus]